MSVTVENLLAGSSDVRKLIFSAKEWDHEDDAIVVRREPTAKAQSVRFANDDAVQEPAEMALCPELAVLIRGAEVKALIDTGAECNLMSAQLARALKLPITKLTDYKYQAVSYSGMSQRFIGIARNVRVDVHGVQVNAHFFIAQKMDQVECILLGSPYQTSAQLGLWRQGDGTMTCSVRDPHTGVVVEFEIEEPEIEYATQMGQTRKIARLDSQDLKDMTE